MQHLEVLELLLNYRRFLAGSKRSGDGRGCRVATDFVAKRLDEQCQHDRVAGIEIGHYRYSNEKQEFEFAGSGRCLISSGYVPRTRKIAP